MARKSSEQKWRERYSKASYRLRQQIKNLEKRYPESVALERGRLEDWEPLKSLPKDYTLKQLKMRTRLADLFQEGRIGRDEILYEEDAEGSNAAGRAEAEAAAPADHGERDAEDTRADN